MELYVTVTNCFVVEVPDDFDFEDAGPGTVTNMALRLWAEASKPIDTEVGAIEFVNQGTVVYSDHD